LTVASEQTILPTQATLYRCIEMKTVSNPQLHAKTLVTCHVANTETLSSGVRKVTLHPPADALISFIPGQYLELVLKDNMRYAFSIANTSKAGALIELYVLLKDKGDDTCALDKAFQKNNQLLIELPMGECVLQQPLSNIPLILLAGGTGISQLKSILEYCIDLQAKRPIYVYWGARKKEDLFLHDLALEWDQTHDNIHYIPVLSDAKTDDTWTGRQGMVHKEILKDFESLANIDVVACGSPAMVYAAYDDFLLQGMAPEKMISDVFAYAPRD